jgi:hypothetical protein
VERPFEAQVAMCRAKNGEQHLNDLIDNGVEIDLSSREEIENALKYMKNNKSFTSWWMH